jgi:xanthine dehydrogenase accessory factor
MVGMPLDLKVLIRGGGEMASGIAYRLHQSRLKVLITEVAAPTAVRRTVAFAEAAYEGAHTIEGVKAVRVNDVKTVHAEWQKGNIPLFIDPEARVRATVRPHVVIDAIMAKRHSDTKIIDAPLVIGIGPGFTAGVNAHAVIESNRGYNLGRVIWDGAAEPDTGVPAPVAGHANERVLRAPRSGRFKALRDIGDLVERGEIVAEVDDEPLQAEIPGMVRGMLKSGVAIRAGVKVGDIDPRREREYCYSISDKARAIGGGVLEAILHSLERLEVPAL